MIQRFTEVAHGLKLLTEEKGDEHVAIAPFALGPPSIEAAGGAY